MYYPVGWSKTIKLKKHDQEAVLDIQANSERNLFLILTDVSLRVWFCKPSVEIVSYTRNEQSITSFGYNICANWKPDSSIITVQTTDDYLLFFKIGMKDPADELFSQEDSNVAGYKRESAELYIQEKIPALFLIFSYSTKINPGISRIMSAEEAVVVCTKGSEVIGVNWDGTLDYSFNFKQSDMLPCSSSQSSLSSTASLNSTGGGSSSEFDYNIVDIRYSAMIGGFSIVFTNGKGGFLPLFSEQDTETGHKYRPYRLRFVPDTDICVCTAINHKHQLLAFGLRNSEGVICCIDENNSSVLISHRLILSPSSFPNASSTAGSMNCIQWSPDSNVIATCWEKGGFALWTVFGALLTCSLSWDYGLLDSSKSININHFGVLAWGCEGYQLWMSTKSEESDCYDSVSQLSMAKSVLACNPSSTCSGGEDVLLISEDRLYLGVGAVSSPELEINGFSEKDRPMDNMPSTNSNSSVAWEHQPLEIGNHQWIIIQIPVSYLANNWPIRLVAIDGKGSSIAIAGTNGFAHYNLVNRKWKLFGNESQEKDFEVRGGLLWWNDHIVMSCYNLVTGTSEIRAYPQKEKLDNQHLKFVKVPADVLQMSILENHLLLLLIDGSFHLYAFDLNQQHSHLNHVHHRSNSSSSFNSLQFQHQNHNHRKNSSASIVPSNSVASGLSASMSYSSSSSSSTILKIRRLHEIVVQNLNFHPECLISIVLSDLHNEPLVKPKESSILLNDRGKLLLLERVSSNSHSISGASFDSNTTITNGLSDGHSSGYISGGPGHATFSIGGGSGNGRISGDESNHPNNHKAEDSISITSTVKSDESTVPYKVVAVLASRVENVWIPKPSYGHDERPHLTNALWLSCGSSGMGVWLPLFPSQDEKNFSSSRAHNFMSKRIMLPINTHIYPLAVLFSDAVVLGAENDTIFVGKSRPINLPFCVVLRTSQVYLHHILRGLLRQNLGLQAWEIANSCSNLPYFPHSLELLLHEVLEEEATSSQPIPDALLPRVIDFIREFPFFLETVVHCARKTELALWPHLFAIVGPPKDLFQRCMDEKRLETAASFIIILQNLEKGSLSKQYATKLLENVKSERRWQLAKELSRFLSAIDPSDKLENGIHPDTPDNNHKTSAI